MLPRHSPCICGACSHKLAVRLFFEVSDCETETATNIDSGSASEGKHVKDDSLLVATPGQTSLLILEPQKQHDSLLLVLLASPVKVMTIVVIAEL